jgi:hypothetical protein
MSNLKGMKVRFGLKSRGIWDVAGVKTSHIPEGGGDVFTNGEGGVKFCHLTQKLNRNLVMC